MENTSFIVYSASAGSGKTTSLVNEYLKRALSSSENTAFRHILAITFTNKAAGEMRLKILKALELLSKGNFESLGNLDFVASSSRPILVNKASKLLKQLLHNYSDFAVGTIDQFVLRIIQTFAYELGLPHSLEVFLDTDQLLEDVVAELIDQAPKDDLLLQTVIEFSKSQLSEDRSWDIEKSLKAKALLWSKEQHFTELKAFENKDLTDFKQYEIWLKDRYRKTQVQISKNQKEFHKILEHNKLTEKDFTGGYFYKFMNLSVKSPLQVNLSAKWHTNFDDKPHYPNRIAVSSKEKMDLLRDLFIQLHQSTLASVKAIQFYKALLKEVSATSLISYVRRKVEEQTLKEHILPIFRFNDILTEAIGDEVTPYIYERLGVRYRHYLIDEFQDTSRQQWQNLIPLVANSLEGLTSDGLPGSLYLVGDAKQSIYRWRGGSVDQFIGLVTHANPFQAPKQIRHSLFNYRSSQNIVSFNNDLFQFLGDKYLKEEYRTQFLEGCKQEITSSYKGYVSLQWTSPDEDRGGLIQQVLDQVRIFIKDGIKLSDICILTRKNKDALELAEAFAREKISVSSSESLLVSSSPQVAFLIATLKLIQQPENFQRKFDWLNMQADRNGLIKEKHFYITNYLNGPIERFLGAPNAAHELAVKERISSLSLYELVEELIRQLNLQNSVDMHLSVFVDFVLQFSTQKGGWLDAFLENWEYTSKKLSLGEEERADALQIMTIHKAKGLEFPIVIYPLFKQLLYDPDRDGNWYHWDKSEKAPLSKSLIRLNATVAGTSEKLEEMHERFRYNQLVDQIHLLYVAFTRAQQEMYIMDVGFKNTKGESLQYVSQWLSEYLIEKDLWAEDKMAYSWGSQNRSYDHNVENKTLEESTSQYLNFYSDPRNSERLRLESHKRKLLDKKGDGAVKYGIIAHEILAKARNREEGIALLDRMEFLGKINKIVRLQLEEMINQVFLSPELMPFYSESNTSLAEREIFMSSKATLRPDRVLFHEEGGCSLLDFKTGKPSDDHKNQLLEYAMVLEEMGYPTKHRWLVYLGLSPNLEKI